LNSRRPSDARLYALLTLMVFFWALNFIIAKVALREFPPLMVAGLRTVLSGAFMWPLYLARSNRPLQPNRWTASDVPSLLAAGVLGVVLNQLFFVVGLSMTSVGHAAIIIGIGPILVLLIAASAGQERITPRKVAGLAVAAIGVVILQFGRESVRGPSLLGDTFIFLAALIFALYTVMGKRLTGKHDSITINTFAYVAGAVVLLPLTAWEGTRHSLSGISAGAWLSVGYMALFSSVLSYLIYSYALRFLPASRVSTFSYLQPLLATIMAAMFLREMPAAGFLTGGTLVLGGVFLTERG
jgi:drug/metabolite transporter (DMT)-like permease